MTSEKLKEITEKVKDTFVQALYIIECAESDEQYDLLDLIASLHNELYREVTGKYYDYAFHWTNKGGYNGIDDSIFKEVNHGEEEKTYKDIN